jgi:phosphate transport system protein
MAQDLRNIIAGLKAEDDLQKAIAVWHRDDQIDGIYVDLLSNLRASMTEDSDNIKTYTGLIFVAKCCERIGEHITNLAENVHYIERGKSFIVGRMPFDG